MFRGRLAPWFALHGRGSFRGDGVRCGLRLAPAGGKLPFCQTAALLYSAACQLVGGPASGALHLIGGLLFAILRSLGPLV